MVFDVEWLVVQWILSDRGKMEGNERMFFMVWSDAKIYQYYKGFWDKSQAADWPDSNSHYGSSFLCDGRRSRLAAKPSPLRLGQETFGER
jgi:hypothetical protein